jgi:aspartate/methionine/tyrosine aminotransferase
MTPGYQQVRGLAANAGADVVDLPLDRERGWQLDVGVLDEAVRPGTSLVSINTPNNPTGAILSDAELDAVVTAADRVGAWVHSDEVYRGSELDGPEAPSAWGRHDKVLAVGSLSKAYGLSGLRVGWVVGPEDVIAELWRRHEYATISTASLSMVLAETALEPAVRQRLLDRQRTLALAGRTTLLDWVAPIPTTSPSNRPPRPPWACPGCCTPPTPSPSPRPSESRPMSWCARASSSEPRATCA